VPRLFELPTALLEYLDRLQSPAFQVATPSDYEIYNIAHSLIIDYSWWIHSYCIKTIAPRAPLTYLSSEKKMLRHQLCSTRYAAVWDNNCLKRTFAIKVATTDDLMEAITCLPLNRHFSWWTKMNIIQRRAVVSPWRMHCMYSGMAKGTSWAEATSNSEKIRPVALAIVELHESEGIRQLVSQ